MKGLTISRSRAVISRRRPASSMSPSPVIAFMPRTSAPRSFSTTKSAPRSMNALTGAGTSTRARPITSRTDLPVRSGFCSEPERANSLPMMRWLSTNQV